MQLVVELAEAASFKRDVTIELSRKRIDLNIEGGVQLVGDLAHEAVGDASEWFVEEGFEGFDEDTRYLVVDIRKRESFLDWPAPLKSDFGATLPARSVLIGGKGDAQKKGTAQQLASYQILQKLPSAVRGDVYARMPPSDGLASDRLYFVGKVIAEVADASASLATQQLLVREHARLYQPSIFGGSTDEEIELWLAPGNTEVRVAQNELSLRRWVAPPTDVELPAVGACGFEPETLPPPQQGASVEPFSVRRDAEGQPIGAAFKAPIVAPDEVPGGYEKWLEAQ